MALSKSQYATMTIDEVKTSCVEESETAVLVFSLEYWNPRLHKRRVGYSRQKKGTKNTFSRSKKVTDSQLPPTFSGTGTILVGVPASSNSLPRVRYFLSPRPVFGIPAFHTSRPRLAHFASLSSHVPVHASQCPGVPMLQSHFYS